MIQRIKDIFDADTAKVALATILPGGLTLASVNTIIQLVVGIGSAIYIWRKVLRPTKGKDEDTDI